MLKIENIKKTSPDTVFTNPTLKATVLEVGEIEPASGKAKAKFFAILADETGYIPCTVYKENEKPKFVKDKGVILMNVMVKRSYVAVTERTQVAMCRGFTLPHAVIESALKLPGEPNMDSSMVLHSSVKTLTGVKGKVVKVEDLTTKDFNNEPLNFQDIHLKDKNDKLVVALWDNLADTMKKGQLVKITKCKVKLFNGVKKLTTTQSSSYEIISNDDDLDNVSSEDEDLFDDKAAPSDNNLVRGTINAVFEMDPYLACPMAGCNNTKLFTIEVEGKYLMKCKLCKGQFTASSANSYLRTVVFFQSNCDSGKKVAMFLPQVKKIFECRGIEFEMSWDAKELLENFCELIPIQCGCKIINNTIRDIIMKRDVI